MNTAKSVAYGWAILVVAAGGSYYYAKKDLKGRKLDPALREARLGQGGSSSKGNITYGGRRGGDTKTSPGPNASTKADSTGEDRLKEMDAQSSSSSQYRNQSTTQHRTTLEDQPEKSATRKPGRVAMDSKPTGVDTSTSGPGPMDER